MRSTLSGFRPPSLDLLRYLRGQCLHTPKSLRTRYSPSQHHSYRRRSSSKPHVASEGESDTCNSLSGTTITSLRAPSLMKPTSTDSDTSSEFPNLAILDRVKYEKDHHSTTWTEDVFTFEQLLFESDVSQSLTDVARFKRLVDHPQLVDDAQLWLCLLRFRERIYGLAGIRTILQGLLSRDVSVLRRQFWLKRKFWTVSCAAFLRLALCDIHMLPDVINYATRVRKVSRVKWEQLYVKVIRQLATSHQDITPWHNAMINDHAPSGRDLCWLFNDTGINFQMQKRIYLANRHRDLYDQLMSRLIRQGEHDRAFAWHSFLLANGDVPSNERVFQPMLRYFKTYDRLRASAIEESLLAVGVSTSTIVEKKAFNNTSITREVVSLAQGETHNISPKGYNDSLGARWFATTWISLDMAISTIVALGVSQIGPLSLQAIALRDPDPIAVYERIEQLRGLSINFDNTAYTRAIVGLAVDRDAQNLQALLNNDLHPDEYDDWVLQESLLKVANRLEDWDKVHLLMKVRAYSTGFVVASLDHARVPIWTHDNSSLRKLAQENRVDKILPLLQKMRNQRVMVEARTVKTLVASLLRPRAQGKRPETHLTHEGHDLALVKSILIAVLKSGSSVPFGAWRELCRRLGMTGRLQELESLCLFLAKWYRSNSVLAVNETSLITPALQDRSIVPAGVRTTNSLHPLRKLFPISFQKSLIEWGFIHRASIHKARQAIVDFTIDSSASYVWGIRLLRQLGEEGVAVKGLHITRAIENRLTVLFGPGRSNRRANRVTRARNTESMESVIENVNRAWGMPLFLSVELLRKKMSTQHEKRTARRFRRDQRKEANV